MRAEIRSIPHLPHWLTVRDLASRTLANELSVDFGPGESEVIALGVELRAGVLIDELRARAAARQSGLTVVGLASLSLRAKRRGLLPRVKPVLDELERVRFWLSPRLREMTLREAGELE